MGHNPLQFCSICVILLLLFKMKSNVTKQNVWKLVHACQNLAKWGLYNKAENTAALRAQTRQKIMRKLHSIWLRHSSKLQQFGRTWLTHWCNDGKQSQWLLRRAVYDITNLLLYWLVDTDWWRCQSVTASECLSYFTSAAQHYTSTCMYCTFMSLWTKCMKSMFPGDVFVMLKELQKLQRW